MLDLALIQACSPNVPPAVVNAIVRTESSFNQYAIGVNRGAKLNRQPKSYSEAVSTAKQLLARGANIDMGLGQINSANLGWLRLSVEQVFDSCTNLKAMQTVYNSCYVRAGNSGLGNKMQRAWSCYNTGNIRNGFSNGYVNKVTGNYNYFVQRLKPALPQPTYQAPNQALSNQTIVAKSENVAMPIQVQNSDLIPLEDVNVISSDLTSHEVAAQEKPKNPNGNVFLMQKSSIFNAD